MSVLAGLLLLASRAGRTLARGGAQRAALLNASILLAFVAVEVATRVVVARSSAHLFHRRAASTRLEFEPDASLLPGVPGGRTRYTTNARGVRGPELPPVREAAYRILCVGGSTTECVYLDDGATWPALLGARLNARPGARPTWVGNVGISGFSSVQDLRFVAESDLVPDVDALVVMTGLNDWIGYLAGDVPVEEPLWRRTEIARHLRLALDRPELERWAHGSRLLDRDGSNIVLFRSRRRAAPELDRVPELARPLSEFRERVRAIATLARARGVRPVLVTQTAVWKRDLSARARGLLWLGASPWLHAFLSPGALREGLDRYDETVLAIARELGVECVDLSSMNGNEAYFYDDCHFTLEGAREVARLVARPFESAPAR